MSWFSAHARGHHGYPQPEDSYQARTYEDFCPHCGIHGAQIAPFRIKGTNSAPSSDFLKLNWCFDEFLVTPDVAAKMTERGLTGASFGPVLGHRNGQELSSRLQLRIDTVIACAETSAIPRVICAEENEEGRWVLPGTIRPSAPYCGRVKFHPPTSLSVDGAALSNAPDVFHTNEWFGSGASAFRLTVCSRRFVDFVAEYKFRGLAFEAARTWDRSRRAV